MLREGDLDCCLYDLRDEDYTILSYLEQWERSQTAIQEATSASHQAAVRTGDELIKATKMEYRREVKTVFEAEISSSMDEVKQHNAEATATVLDELVKKYQYPHPRSIDWRYVLKREMPIYYYQRCVALGKLLKPDEIDQDDFLPSWKMFINRFHFTFDELVDKASFEAEWAGCGSFLILEQQYQAQLRARQIIDRRQTDIDDVVSCQLHKIMAEAQAERLRREREEQERAAEAERQKRIAEQDAAYRAAQAQLQEKLHKIPVVKTTGVDSHGEQISPSDMPPVSGRVNSLFGNLCKAVGGLLEDLLDAFLT